MNRHNGSFQKYFFIQTVLLVLGHEEITGMVTVRT